MRTRRKLKWRKSSLTLRTKSLRFKRKRRRRVRIRYVYIVCSHCWEEKMRMKKKKACGCHHCHDSHQHISCGCGCCSDSKANYEGYGPQGPIGPQGACKGFASINQSFSPGVTNGLINLLLPIFINTGDATAFNESNNNGYQNTA